MIKMFISKPKITQTHDKAILSACVKCGKWEKELWYEVEKKYKDALCEDNVDAFVLALLPWCMTNSTKENQIVIESDSKISKKLLMQLRAFYIPIVAKYISYCDEVKIAIDAYDNNGRQGSAVVSGVSGGADSFYTLTRFTKADCDFPITHGICVNTGVYGGFESDTQKQLYQTAVDVCNEMDLQLIYVTSNIMLEVYKKQMATNVSFVYMSMGLALQNLIGVYYFSSEVDAGKFRFDEINAEMYDLFSVHMFGNGRVAFYSAGSEVTRMEKIDYISDFPVTYNKIRICPNPVNGRQCQKCVKCTETMCALDVLGKLDRYSEVYDIEEYKKNYSHHWGYILLAPKTMPNLREILVGYKKKYGRPKLSAYIACARKWIKRGFTSDNKKRIKLQDVVDKP